jgi:hypothetical protein
MIRRRTMLETPDVAPDGTWCYFLSTTTLVDFDPFARIQPSMLQALWMKDDGSDVDEIGWPGSAYYQLDLWPRSSGDDLILFPDGVEELSWLQMAGWSMEDRRQGVREIEEFGDVSRTNTARQMARWEIERLRSIASPPALFTEPV